MESKEEVNMEAATIDEGKVSSETNCEDNKDTEMRMNPQTYRSPAGIETRQADFNRRPQRRHFPEKTNSNIFSDTEPNDCGDSSTRDRFDFKKRKSLWSGVR